MRRPIPRFERGAQAALVTLLTLGAASSAWAHGGQAAPPPPPPPTPEWMKPDPYAPPRPPALPKGPLKPPTTPPLPTVPRPNPPTTFKPGSSAPPSVPTTTPDGSPPTGSPPPSSPAPTPPVTTPAPTAHPAADGAPDAGAATGRRDRTRDGRRFAASSLDWTTWWDMNADRFRHGTGLRAGPVTGNPDDADRVRDQARALEVVPFLRAVAAGAHGDDADLIASAFIALGKTTAEPDDADRMLATLVDPHAPTLAREGAAIGLGCLRRTDAERRFDGRFLDRVRRALLDAFDDDRVPVRVRCLAAFALGLLGDQPGNASDAFTRDLRGTTQAIWSRLLEPRTGPEATVALLSALALHPSAGVPSGVQEALRALAVTGRLAGRDRGDVAQAHAVVAYAKLVGPEAVGFLLGLAKGSHHPADVRRSAVLALGVLGPRLEPAVRATAVRELLGPARRGDPDTAGFALLSIGRLVGAGLQASPTADLPHGAEILVDATDHGSGATRPFAALALGLALRAGESDGPCVARARLHDRAVETFTAVLARTTEDPATRAACALGLGLARDHASAARLTHLLLDDRTDDDVPRARGRCAGPPRPARAGDPRRAAVGAGAPRVR